MDVMIAGTDFESIADFLNDALPDAIVRSVPVDQLAEAIGETDILIPAMSHIDRNLIAAGSRLRLIQQWGSGLDGVDIPAAADCRIPVANVPTAGTGNAESVAEWAMMAALCLARRYPELEDVVRRGSGWGGPSGKGLLGKRAGLLGFGGIGRTLARRLRPFGMEMRAVRRSDDPEAARREGLEWVRSYEALPELLASSDFLFIGVPLTAETAGMIGAEELALMPQGSFVINAARGPVLDHDALVKALTAGHLGGAALDVFHTEPLPISDPILSAPNVLLTPHIAGVTDNSYQGIGDAVAENIRRVMEDRPPLNCANEVIFNS